MGRRHGGIVLALFAPAPALVVGAVVMHGGDIPSMIWQLNLAAGLVGLVLAAIVMARAPSAAPKSGISGAALIVGLTVLSGTLLAPGIDGVHRWLPVGPVPIHGAALLLPALLVLLVELRWDLAIATASAVLIILLSQPDVAQAGSFCAAWIAIVLYRRERGSTAVVVSALLIAAATLLRKDPLDPVPHVEGILGMAVSHGMLLGCVAVISVAMVPLSLVVLLRRPVGIALGVYVAGMLMATSLGHYPVPFLGYGVSPILGYYGGMAMHARLGPSGPRRDRVQEFCPQLLAGAVGGGSLPEGSRGPVRRP